MKLFFATLLFITFITVPDYAQGKKDAEAMVKKAITYYRSYGRDKLILEVCSAKGRFVDGELYVSLYDPTGQCIADGANLKMLGKNWTDLKDSDGKPFIQERIDATKNAVSGWQTYKWINPVTRQIEPRYTYFEKVDNIIFACGSFKK